MHELWAGLEICISCSPISPLPTRVSCVEEVLGSTTRCLNRPEHFYINLVLKSFAPLNVHSGVVHLPVGPSEVFGRCLHYCRSRNDE